MEKKMKARVVLYVFLATLFFAFFLIAQQLIVNFHPQIPAKSSASKEPLFQVKSAKDLEILDEQLYEFSAKAVEMKEVVLVTGGSGFICSHFVDLLLREGYQVIVMDRTLQPTLDGSRANWGMKKGNKRVPSFIHVYGDVTNKDDVELIPNVPISYVFHCAGAPPPSEFQTNSTHLATPAPSRIPTEGIHERLSQRQTISEQQLTIRKEIQDEYDRLHVESTRNLLNLFESRDYPVAKFIVLSTTDIYGPLAKSFLPFSKRRNHPNPPNPWAQSKLNMEKLIQKTWRKRSMVKSHAIIRPTTVYGPRQTEGMVPDLVHSALRGHPIDLPMHGMYTRDFIYVSDLVQAIYAVMLFPKGYVEVNVGTSETTTLDEFAHTLQTLSDSSSPIHHSKSVIPDITNQQAEMNLVTPESPVPLRSGLDLTIDSLRTPDDSPRTRSSPSIPRSFSISSAVGI